MKKSFSAAAVLCCILLMAGCAGNKSTAPELDYEALNAQALEEYLQPVHPGVRGQVPFWNKFATKYIYAPAFDFDDVENAVGYTYTAEAGGQFFIFGNESPRADLGEIWQEMPVGPVELTVQAYDGEGEPLGEPQKCSFEKDNPFCGPYDPAPIGYREAAIRTAKALHDSPIGQSWAKPGKPDTTYFYNCYACKIWSGIAQTECFLAREVPEYRDAALQIARNACDGLMAFSQPEGAPLAFFPPTYYYGDNWEAKSSVLRFNRGKTMFLEATYAANALLDLYDLTKEQKYFDHAVGIAKTYQKLQAQDGSWPVKVILETAEPVNNARCLPADILMLANRLKVKYGVEGFEEMVEKGDKWMWDNTISEFKFDGQFEDVPIEDKVPYQNLTHCTAGDCMEYLMTKPVFEKSDLKTCIEIARWAEDQFTRWHSKVEKDADALSATEGVFTSPFVFEQYSWKNPVDASIAKVANNFMHIYHKTGDLLCLAKAKALVDTLIKIQDPETGTMPTIPDSDTKYSPDDIWANCVYYSIGTLMRMADIYEN